MIDEGRRKKTMYHILVVEDEQGIREAISIYLKNQGYHVYEAENGKQGLEMINQHTIHLAIVDIMMPVMDGISMVLKVREKFDFPIIFLSAKSEDIDKITGLNIGADDYMTKPFGSMELIARVNSQLRRYQQILDLKDNKSLKKEHKLINGGLELDIYTKEVKIDGRNVQLRPKEFQILEMLMKSPGRVYSANQIYENIWNEEAVNTQTIMVHVRKLREKIEINPKQPKYLKVVWGVGYKIEKVE